MAKTMHRVDKKSYRSSISLNEKELPEMKGWKVGEKYTLTIEVEMTGQRQESDYASMPMPDMSMAAAGVRQEPPKILTGEFKINAVGVEEKG
jgi:hypothetical protein